LHRTAWSLAEEMKKDRWHQEVIVTLKPVAVLFSELASMLNRRGYSTDGSGEVFFYARKDNIEKWQTDTLITVSAFINDTEVDYYEDEAQEISKIELGYLLPWQPIKNASTFIAEAWGLAGELGAHISIGDELISKEDLSAIINEYAADLEQRLEAPGGEFLAQAIAQDLPI
jgi:hypothetical protein